MYAIKYKVDRLYFLILSKIIVNEKTSITHMNGKCAMLQTTTGENMDNGKSIYWQNMVLNYNIWHNY